MWSAETFQNNGVLTLQIHPAQKNVYVYLS